jgi:hypothetical protein
VELGRVYIEEDDHPHVDICMVYFSVALEPFKASCTHQTSRVSCALRL